jgi:hypothetical protein
MWRGSHNPQAGVDLGLHVRRRFFRRAVFERQQLRQDGGEAAGEGIAFIVEIAPFAGVALEMVELVGDKG